MIVCIVRWVWSVGGVLALQSLRGGSRPSQQFASFGESESQPFFLTLLFSFVGHFSLCG